LVRDITAVEARFNRADSGATVAIDIVTIVAFVVDDETITAPHVASNERSRGDESDRAGARGEGFIEAGGSEVAGSTSDGTFVDSVETAYCVSTEAAESIQLAVINLGTSSERCITNQGDGGGSLSFGGIAEDGISGHGIETRCAGNVSLVDRVNADGGKVAVTAESVDGAVINQVATSEGGITNWDDPRHSLRVLSLVLVGNNGTSPITRNTGDISSIDHVGAGTSVVSLTAEAVDFAVVDQVATLEFVISNQKDGRSSRGNRRVTRQASDSSVVDTIGARLGVLILFGKSINGTVIDLCAAKEGSRTGQLNRSCGRENCGIASSASDGSLVDVVLASDGVVSFATVSVDLAVIDQCTTSEGCSSIQSDGGSIGGNSRVARFASDSSLVDTVGARQSVVLLIAETVDLAVIDFSTALESIRATQFNGRSGRFDGIITRQASDGSLVNTALALRGEFSLSRKSVFLAGVDQRAAHERCRIDQSDGRSSGGLGSVTGLASNGSGSSIRNAAGRELGFTAVSVQDAAISKSTSKEFARSGDLDPSDSTGKLSSVGDRTQLVIGLRVVSNIASDVSLVNTVHARSMGRESAESVFLAVVDEGAAKERKSSSYDDGRIGRRESSVTVQAHNGTRVDTFNALFSEFGLSRETVFLADIDQDASKERCFPSKSDGRAGVRGASECVVTRFTDDGSNLFTRNAISNEIGFTAGTYGGTEIFLFATRENSSSGQGDGSDAHAQTVGKPTRCACDGTSVRGRSVDALNDVGARASSVFGAVINGLTVFLGRNDRGVSVVAFTVVVTTLSTVTFFRGRNFSITAVNGRQSITTSHNVRDTETAISERRRTSTSNTSSNSQRNKLSRPRVKDFVDGATPIPDVRVGKSAQGSALGHDVGIVKATRSSLREERSSSTGKGLQKGDNLATGAVIITRERSIKTSFGRICSNKGKDRSG
jgi:hypothetical protein